MASVPGWPLAMAVRLSLPAVDVGASVCPSAPGTSRMRPQGLPRWLRLQRRVDFLRVQRGGTKHHLRNFLVFVSPIAGRSQQADPSPSVLGITVTKKVGNAVARNRIKRLVREVFRRERATLPSGFRLVWVAKRSCSALTFTEVVSDLQALARRLRRRPSVVRSQTSPCKPATECS